MPGRNYMNDFSVALVADLGNNDREKVAEAHPL
jgi:hypothetical protein